MIVERPVSELLELQVWEPTRNRWEAWTGPLQSLTITRGGQRRGPAVSVDVGTLAAVMRNAGDPLGGSDLRPNLPVRLREATTLPQFVTLPGSVLLASDFTPAGTAPWAAAGAVTLSRSTTQFRSGPASLAYTATTAQTGSAMARLSVTGLTIGRTYRVEAWCYTEGAPHYVALGLGSGAAIIPSLAAGTWTPLSFDVEAVPGSSTLLWIAQDAGKLAQAYLDDLTITELPHVVPNPDWDDVPSIWTGRLNDLDTSYAVSKSTGEETTTVNLSAVDAVAAHAAITRYGAVVEAGAGYETWANRIARLAGSATTEVSTPLDDQPIVRYAI